MQIEADPGFRLGLSLSQQEIMTGCSTMAYFSSRGYCPKSSEIGVLRAFMHHAPWIETRIFTQIIGIESNFGDGRD
jgi:hypothetical protein